MIWLHYCVCIIDASGCVYLCVCAYGVFFPFKSCRYCCRRSRCKRKAGMRSSFVFHFTFRVTFSANCSLLTVASPCLGKINFKNVGGGEERALSPKAGVLMPSTTEPQTYTAHLPPLKNHFPFYPPGPGREWAARQRGAPTQGQTPMFAARLGWLASLGCIPRV